MLHNNMKKYLTLFFSITITISIITGCKAKKVEKITDAEKVAIEYTISKNNPFYYVTLEETNQLLKEEGILYIGYPESDAAKQIVMILTELSKIEKISIAYYNPKQSTKNKENDALAQTLDQEQLLVPGLYFIKAGKIISKDTSLAFEPIDYFTKEMKQELTKKYQKMIKDYQEMAKS